MGKKVVLAYSGGLDTSAALVYLKEKGFDVVAFCADVGQDENFEAVRRRALELGADKIIVEDLRDEFVKKYVFKMLKANAEYEGYLLGTSIARPAIAKRQVEIAVKEGAEFVAHGATGKGNDQIRFELAYMKLAPHIKILAPWREWSFQSRKDLVEYLRRKGFNLSYEEKQYSVDENIMHTSFEGGIIEDIEKPYPLSIFKKVVPPEFANEKGEEVEIEFESSEPVVLNGVRMSPSELLLELNKIGGRNGIGIRDIVETRANGIKSRGIYETPGYEIILFAKRSLEAIVIDGNVRKLMAVLSPIYSELVYKGFWFSDEMELLQAFYDKATEKVTGKVRLFLYKGNIRILSRSSIYSSYRKSVVSFETGGGDISAWAEGFIKTLGIRFLLKQ